LSAGFTVTLDGPPSPSTLSRRQSLRVLEASARRRATSPRETARSRSPCGVPGCRTRAAPASGAGIPWPIPGAARAAGRSQPKGAQPARDGEEAWRLRCWFILKINTALARELRKLDPALVSAELREAPSC